MVVRTNVSIDDTKVRDRDPLDSLRLYPGCLIYPGDIRPYAKLDGLTLLRAARPFVSRALHRRLHFSPLVFVFIPKRHVPSLNCPAKNRSPTTSPPPPPSLLLLLFFSCLYLDEERLVVEKETLSVPTIGFRPMQSTRIVHQ